MKTFKHSIIVALCVLAGGMVFAAPAVAGDGDLYILSLSQEKIDLIEQNVVNALTSEIPGMQADAAALVRELKSLRPEQSYAGCVVPLMAIVKNEDADPATRILAALALDKLESSMGYFAISRTALFTDNPRVKHVCAWLAYERKVGKAWDDKGMAYIEPLEEIDFDGN